MAVQYSTISEKLDLARRDLLDLGLRNTLLSYRVPKTRGVEIVEGDAAQVFQWLVTEGRTLSFLPIPEKDLFPADAASTKDATETGKSGRRFALQTALENKSLQTRLLATYYAARTHIEERGANILYLAIGMLHWFEDDNSDKVLRAPLLLIPAELERISAREKFTLKYNGDEVEGNLSLSTKLKSDFGIKYPDFPELEDLDVGEYLSKVGRTVKGMKRWQVVAEEISLGFFSFGKFLMYRDLAPENWCSKENPDGSPMLAAMLQSGFNDTASPYDESDFLDKLIAPNAVHNVMDTDSSQALALLDVRAARNLVIQGPPGTGKSQTITNMIADALGEGKKVLFVAEKMAALDVVKRRLDKVSLGDACLELHSHTAKKKALLDELKRTASLGKPKLDGVRTELVLYERLRDQLNEYCLAVNTPLGESGYNPYQLMGELVAIQRELDGVRLHQFGPNGAKVIAQEFQGWNRSLLAQKEVLARNLQAHLTVMGKPGSHPFVLSRLTALLPSDKQRLESALSSVIDSANNLNAHQAALSALMGIETRGDIADAKVLCKAAQRAMQAPHLKGLELRTGEWQARRDELNELFRAGERFTALHRQFDAVLIPEAWDQELLHARQVLNALGKKWWRMLSSEYRRIRNQVAGLCKGPRPKDADFQLSLVDAVMESIRQKKAFGEHEQLGKTLFGAQWQGLRSDWAVLRRVSEWIIDLYRDVGDGQLPSGIISFLAGDPAVDTLKGKVVDVEQALQAFEAASLGLFEGLSIQADGRELLTQQTLAAQAGIFAQMLERLDSLQDQIDFNNLAGALRKEGLAWLVETALRWDFADRHLVHFLRHTFFESLLRKAYADREALSNFDGVSHGNVRRQFQELDSASLQVTRLQLAEKHWNALPKLTSHGQAGVLLREFEKRARHLPIRRLMETAGNVIQAIKPVFMMSPMSIATFAPPGSVRFDLIIFDEASQVKPVDGFGALLRGDQLVVVGDSKQLPPTSFFDTLTGNDEIEDVGDEIATADIESILGLMASQGAPQKMLRWHYRSRHESLIALSNSEFYDNRLVVFPGPHMARPGTGLIFHHLPNTAYDRGKTRTNQREAEAVARAVMNHAKTASNLTLGVAAFSLAQSDAILDHLERLRHEDPSAEQFFTAHPYEPFFVKNLESVQGDERDVILISVGYGRTEDGYLSMSFGALNNIGGERRLNVLITRARQNCQVFTNLTHNDIDLSRTQSRGVAALKAFLKYAETGIIDVPDAGGAETDSPFEDEVLKAIESAGYKLAKQVGSGGFKIDLAVVDPLQPGRYLLGIECDGATYHSSRSTRDRDRLRQQVLENLGWRIYRIWSRDWFSNPTRELNRAVQAIEEAKAWTHQKSEAVAAAQRQLEVSAPNIQRSDTARRAVEHKLKAKEYEICELTVRINGQELHEVPTHRLAQWILKVVEAEYPVHISEVGRRIADAAGVRRIGNRIESAFQDAIAFAVQNCEIERKQGDFLWLAGKSVLTLRDRSSFPSSSKKLELIAPEEIALAIRRVVEVSYGIEQAEVAPAVCRLFGFSRTTEEMVSAVNKILVSLIKAEELRSVDGHVSILEPQMR